MDPRNGELSRAMRNRALELFVLPITETGITHAQIRSSFGLESSMYRYRNFAIPSAVQPNNVVEQEYDNILVDHLSFQDCSLAIRFQEQISQGLLDTSIVSDQGRFTESLELVPHIDARWTTAAQELSPLSLSKLNGGHVQVSALAYQLTGEAILIVRYVYIVNPSIKQRYPHSIQCSICFQRSLLV